MVSDLKVSLCAVQLRKVMLFNTKVISLMSLSKTSALSVARRRGGAAVISNVDKNFEFFII